MTPTGVRSAHLPAGSHLPWAAGRAQLLVIWDLLKERLAHPLIRDAGCLLLEVLAGVLQDLLPPQVARRLQHLVAGQLDTERLIRAVKRTGVEPGEEVLDLRPRQGDIALG